MNVVDNLPSPISWEKAEEITNELLSRLQPLDDQRLTELDSQGGVYVVTYNGTLGFDLNGTDSAQDRVVYVGVSKFNSSRHFKSGATGTSTLRRSLGALLTGRLELSPVPRSSDQEDADRYSNYAFDAESEEKLTAWIRKSFKTAFFRLDKAQIEPVYLGLISYNSPMFNFQNNPGNRYGNQIKQARKLCERAAADNELQ